MRIHTLSRRAVVVGGAVVLALGVGGGLAVAKSKDTSPSAQRDAYLQALADKLGIDVSKLKSALQGVATDRVDALLKAGTITQAQADAMKQAIQSGRLGLGGRGFGFGMRGGFGHGAGHLQAAATYLGLSPADLATQLQGGKSLADVAKAQGKSVDGLVSALVADEKTELDAAVKAGRITQAQADQALANAKTRITAMVNGQMPQGGPGMGMHGGFGMGYRGGFGRGSMPILPGV